MLFVFCVLLNILCPTYTNTGVKLVDADAHISDDPETTTAFHALHGDTQAILTKLHRDPKLVHESHPLVASNASPLFIAANTSATEIVDLLLQYYANATAVDAVSGLTPLTSFVRNGRGTDVARQLLANGANPTKPDKTGKSAAAYVAMLLSRVKQSDRNIEEARRLVELTQLFDIYSVQGAEGFEDAPGAWRMHAYNSKDAHPDASFFYHVDSGRQRYSKPASLAWTRIVRNATSAGTGGHTMIARVFVNQVTGQTLLRVPKALRWRFIRTPTGDEYWMSTESNSSLAEAPIELPEEMAREIRALPNAFWTNKVLGVNQWSEPDVGGWNVAADRHGRAYYVHERTGESSWLKPPEFAWMMIVNNDARTSATHPYWYVNENTGERTWDEPEAVAWTLMDELSGELARYRPCPAMTSGEASEKSRHFSMKKGTGPGGGHSNNNIEL